MARFSLHAMLTRFLASCPFMIKLVGVHAQAFFAFIASQSGPFGLEEIASSLSHSPSHFDFLLGSFGSLCLFLSKCHINI
uniref:Plant methyltransferase dimerisation domain-containing protein n=1 Tax=Setaria viridis TaxID=4556 RepID=A0A4U6TXP6_SETVI|nr:hypothetical protein SEVIR_7G213101v2 [Setaria viridis]